MTANTETTEIKVVKIHCAIADLIVGYTVYVEDDGSGPYISISPVGDGDDDEDRSSFTLEEDYRCLALLDDTDSCSEDLGLYHWKFWNHKEGAGNVWLTSTLGADASEEEVLAFLADCLAEEARVAEALS